MAAANGHVCPPLHGLKHQGQAGFVVLHIAVDYGDVFGGGGQHTFDDGRGQAAPADTTDAAHPWVGLGNALGLGAGAVRAVVIDEHHFPGKTGERLFECRDHGCHVRAFIIARYNDR